MDRMKIKAIIMSSGGPMTRQLALWLSENGISWGWGSSEYGIDLARSHNCTKFLRHYAPLGFTHLLGIDHDMIPIRETRHILRGDNELIYCGYNGRHGSKGHAGDGDFGAACFRVSADLLNRMEQPWWNTTVIDGRRRECECLWFRRRAIAAGATVRMVGLIGHEQKCIIVPSDDPPGYIVVWPEQLEAKRKGAPV